MCRQIERDQPHLNVPHACNVLAGKYEEMCAAKVKLAQANKELNLEQQQLRERLELVETLLFKQYRGSGDGPAPPSRVSTADSSASSDSDSQQDTNEHGAWWSCRLDA